MSITQMEEEDMCVCSVGLNVIIFDVHLENQSFQHRITGFLIDGHIRALVRHAEASNTGPTIALHKYDAICGCRVHVIKSRHNASIGFVHRAAECWLELVEMHILVVGKPRPWATVRDE